MASQFHNRTRLRILCQSSGAGGFAGTVEFDLEKSKICFQPEATTSIDASCLPMTRSEDDRSAFGGIRSWIAPELNAFISASLNGAEVYNHHTVLRQIQDRPDLHLKFLKLDFRQLTAEDGVLQRVTRPLHRLINLAVAFGLRDVVGDEVDVAHGGRRGLGLRVEG